MTTKLRSDDVQSQTTILEESTDRCEKALIMWTTGWWSFQPRHGGMRCLGWLYVVLHRISTVPYGIACLGQFSDALGILSAHPATNNHPQSAVAVLSKSTGPEGAKPRIVTVRWSLFGPTSCAPPPAQPVERPALMSSLTRAIVNGTHSESTLATQIEFALSVGPPLHLGFLLLAIVLFTFTFIDPVSKKSSVSAHILRVCLGLGAIYGFYDFGFGYYMTHDERISRQVSCAVSQFRSLRLQLQRRRHLAI